MTQEKNNGLYSGNERGAEIKRDVYKGFTYKILDMGTHPCAYVQIPKDHMLYNVGYDSIRIDVHGGLTYAGLGKGKEEGEYWIGWDYAHLGDYYDHDKITTVSGDKKWTIPEIEKHCREVIDQILKIKKFQKGEYYYATHERDY